MLSIPHYHEFGGRLYKAVTWDCRKIIQDDPFSRQILDVVRTVKNDHGQRVTPVVKNMWMFSPMHRCEDAKCASTMDCYYRVEERWDVTVTTPSRFVRCFA